MASLISSTAVFLVFLLLSAASVLPSLAQPPTSVVVTGVQVSSILACSVTAFPPGKPLVGANVTVTCANGLITTIASAITNDYGFFNLTLNIPSGLVITSPILPCTATVKVSGANCTLLPPSTLTSVISVGTFATTPIGSVLINAVLGPLI